MGELHGAKIGYAENKKAEGSFHLFFRLNLAFIAGLFASNLA